MNKDSKIYVAGHRGLVGSALVRKLEKEGFTNIISKTHSELDLCSQLEVEKFFDKEQPECVFLAAAKVGGILANNSYRAEFIYENLMIASNVIHAAWKYKVKKLLFLGSSCIYPRNAAQPMDEKVLLTSELEYTNEPYAIAKIAGIKLCESYNLQYGTNFLSVMPTNLYGPNDNYDLETSHVLPAMVRKFHLAKLLDEGNKAEIVKNLECATWDEASKLLEKHGISKGRITLWGTGAPKREFLHVDDLASACLHMMEKVEFKHLSKCKKEIRNTHLNIGTGIDLSINELAETIKEIVGYSGEINWDTTKPDGTPRKLLNIDEVLKVGWRATISLAEGIQKVYSEYLGEDF